MPLRLLPCSRTAAGCRREPLLASTRRLTRLCQALRRVPLPQCESSCPIESLWGIDVHLAPWVDRFRILDGCVAVTHWASLLFRSEFYCTRAPCAKMFVIIHEDGG